MKLLNTREAADILGVRPSVIKRFVMEGRFTALKHVRHDWLLKEKDLRKIRIINKP